MAVALQRALLISTTLVLAFVGYDAATGVEKKTMIVRVSEIEIHPEDMERYRALLNEEAEASVRLEPGAISILPVVEKERPTQVRILETYASREAYEAHLKTPHFQKYKTATLEMVGR